MKMINRLIFVILVSSATTGSVQRLSADPPVEIKSMFSKASNYEFVKGKFGYGVRYPHMLKYPWDENTFNPQEGTVGCWFKIHAHHTNDWKYNIFHIGIDSAKSRQPNDIDKRMIRVIIERGADWDVKNPGHVIVWYRNQFEGKTYNLTSDRPVPLNKWVNFIMTYQPGSLKIYIDGKLSGELKAIKTMKQASPAQMAIGNSVHNNGPLQNFDEFFSSSRVYAQNEIDYLQQHKFTPDKDTQLYIDFDKNIDALSMGGSKKLSAAFYYTSPREHLFAGRQAEFPVKIINWTLSDPNLTFQYKITDEYDQVLQEEKSKLKVAKNSSCIININSKINKYGRYYVTASLLKTDGEILQKRHWAFGQSVPCIPASKLKDSSFFGMHDRWYYAYPGELSCKHWRNFEMPIRRVYWEGPNKLDCIEPDFKITRASQNGFEIMPVISGDQLKCMPRWARRMAGNKKYSEGWTKAWTSYVHAMISRYKDKVKAWELLNEPNLHMGPDEYFEIAKITYPIAKKANPECIIACPGGIQGNYIPFLRRFLELGGLKYCDVISVHNYWLQDNCDQPEFLQMMKDTVRLVKEYGGRHPIWNSESGSILIGEDKNAKTLTKEKEDKLRKTIKVGKYHHTHFNAKDFLVKQNIYTIAAGYKRLYSYCLPPGDRWTWAVTADNVNLSMLAWNNMVYRLNNCKFIRELSLNEKCKIFEFKNKKNGKHILVGWKRGKSFFSKQVKPESINIELPMERKEITKVDIYGNRETLKPKFGIFRFQLTTTPSYFLDVDTSSIISTKELLKKVYYLPKTSSMEKYDKVIVLLKNPSVSAIKGSLQTKLLKENLKYIDIDNSIHAFVIPPHSSRTLEIPVYKISQYYPVRYIKVFLCFDFQSPYADIAIEKKFRITPTCFYEKSNARAPIGNLEGSDTFIKVMDKSKLVYGIPEPGNSVDQKRTWKDSNDLSFSFKLTKNDNLLNISANINDDELTDNQNASLKDLIILMFADTSNKKVYRLTVSPFSLKHDAPFLKHSTYKNSKGYQSNINIIFKEAPSELRRILKKNTFLFDIAVQDFDSTPVESLHSATVKKGNFALMRWAGNSEYYEDASQLGIVKDSTVNRKQIKTISYLKLREKANNKVTPQSPDGLTGESLHLSKAESICMPLNNKILDLNSGTFMCWVKPEKQIDQARIIHVPFKDKNWMMLKYQKKKNHIYLESVAKFPNTSSGRYNILAAHQKITPNEWHHVAYTWEAGFGRELYINGKYCGIQDYPKNIKKSSDDVILGINLQGSIDSIVIFKRPLGRDEIKKIYNKPKKYIPLDTIGLKCFIDFNKNLEIKTKI